MVFEAECKVCGSKGGDTLLDRGDHRLVRCWECGHAFFWPLPSQEELAEYYSSEEGYLPSIRWTWAEQQRRWEEVLAQKRECIRKAAHVLAGAPRRLLEIGCGHGVGLLAAKDEAWEPFGVEVSEETSKEARERFGLNVFTGTLEQARYPDNRFGLALMFAVLEHIIDPVALLREVRRVLAPGGVVWVTTPNMESTPARRLKDRWEWVAYPKHLHYFSRATRSLAFGRAGLETVIIGTIMGDANQDQLLTVIKDGLGLDTDQEAREVLPLLEKLNRLPTLEAAARKVK